MSDTEKSMAVMFVDICGSTRLFSNLGDNQALEMTSSVIQKLKEITMAEKGRVVEERGDELLCTFKSANNAFWAAQCFQNFMHDGPLSIHTGVHYGTVMVTDNSVFGDTVNMAARMCEIAKQDENILSAAVYAQLSSRFQPLLRDLGQVTVKGKQHPVNIYLAIAGGEDVTAIAGKVEISKEVNASLQLIYQDKQITVNTRYPELICGRHTGCNLIVRNDYTSRWHITIECKQGKFFIFDHSTNGSYIIDTNQQQFFIRREFMQLSSNGVLSLGVEPASNPDHLIYFKKVIIT